MTNDAMPFPTIRADAAFEASALVHAHRSGVNATELDALAQSINRLARDHSTVVPASMEAVLAEFEQLGYVTLSPTPCRTLSVELLCPSALLSTYFWSIWVPRHLYANALKVAVIPLLDDRQEAQHCTVVFRIPGTREAAREFLADLTTQFPGLAPEIVAVQAGNALARQASPAKGAH